MPEHVMDVNGARMWLIKSSLLVTTCVFLFLLIAPLFNYPLEWEQTPRLFEIVLPTFLGYLGTATHFLFHHDEKPQTLKLNGTSQLLSLLVKGPIVVFGLGSIALMFAFGYSNRHGATRGAGMNIDQLAMVISGLLGLLTATTSVAVSYLFSLRHKSQKS
jgi:hypothetical protein